MSAPVFGVLPRDAIIDLGPAPFGGRCGQPHLMTRRPPAAHRFSVHGEVRALCPYHVREAMKRHVAAAEAAE